MRESLCYSIMLSAFKWNYNIIYKILTNEQWCTKDCKTTCAWVWKTAKNSSWPATHFLFIQLCVSWYVGINFCSFRKLRWNTETYSNVKCNVIPNKYRTLVGRQGHQENFGNSDISGYRKNIKPGIESQKWLSVSPKTAWYWTNWINLNFMMDKDKVLLASKNGHWIPALYRLSDKKQNIRDRKKIFGNCFRIMPPQY